MARNLGEVTASIAAGGSFSEAVRIERGKFNFSLWGTWAGTVTVQRSFDQGSTWLDVESFTVNAEQKGDNPEGCLYRFGFKAGAYSSGAAQGRIGQ